MFSATSRKSIARREWESPKYRRRYFGPELNKSAVGLGEKCVSNHPPVSPRDGYWPSFWAKRGEMRLAENIGRSQTHTMEKMSIQRNGDLLRANGKVTLRYEVNCAVRGPVGALVQLQATVTLNTDTIGDNAKVEELARDALLAVLDPA